MAETITPVFSYLKENRIMPQIFTINTVDGKAITGKIRTVEANFLAVETDQSLSFVFQSAIVSITIPRGSYKSLPQTPL